jgi:hypothetical protein
MSPQKNLGESLTGDLGFYQWKNPDEQEIHEQEPWRQPHWIFYFLDHKQPGLVLLILKACETGTKKVKNCCH